ncbi:MAG: oligosaccharide flippase family protein [Bacteroidota bacterium]|nr:oligosaccharide flippase family protein [Bacteroidota bacterium]
MRVENLIKSFFIYGLTSGLSRFISLLLIPVYVRVFSESENGIIDMIQTMCQVFLVFGMLQLETSIQRYYYELDTKKRRRMISTVLIFTTFMSAFGSLLLCLLAKKISFFFFKQMGYSLEIMIASWIIPFLNMSILNFIVLRYLKKSFVFSIVTFFQVLLTTSLVLFFVFKLSLGIKSVFLGQLFGYIVIVAAQFYFLRREFVWCFDLSILKEMLHYSIPQFPARIGSESTARINRFILVTFLSTSSLGLYAVAVKFSSALELINVAFSMAWVPYMYESLKSGSYQIKFRYIYSLALYTTFFLVTFVSLFSTEIVTFFTVPSYYKIKFLLPGLFLFNGLFIIKGIVDIGIAISKRMIYLTYIYLSVAVLNVSFLLIGINVFGLKGVVYSLIFTNFFLILFSWYFTERLHYIGFEIKKFILFYVIIFIITIIQMNIEIPLIHRVLSALILCVLFGIYVYKQKKIWKKLLF